MKQKIFASVLGVAALICTNLASADAHEVVIQKFAFVPAALKVHPGDTITYINNDSADHTATSEDGTLDTGKLTKGSKGVITIPSNATGEIIIHCTYHPKMKETITVLAS